MEGVAATALSSRFHGPFACKTWWYGAPMELLVLGPLEVRRDGQIVELRGSKRRALLALLILHANEIVRSDRLVDELWSNDRPANASAALQSHISRLRKDLGSDVLVTKPWGYVLRADPEAIDLYRFERLLAEAKPLAARERKEKLAEALLLWRGAPLADLSHEPAIAGDIARLEELRLSAIEQRIEAELELGGSLELVPEIETLVAEHPLRERLRGQLILALYRGGRQAEALETYRETRRFLVEELGIEPSPELRELERSILRQDPALVVTAPVTERVQPEPDADRWRWPRSPLAVAAALMLIAAGTALAIVLSRAGGPSETQAAAPAPPPAAPAPPPPPPPPPSPTVSKKPKEPEARPVATVTVPLPSLPATQTTATFQTQTTPAEAPPPPKKKTPPEAAPPQPTTTVKAPTPQPAPPQSLPWDYWFADDFEDPAPDYGLWILNTNAEATVRMMEQNGRLQMTVDPSGLPAGSDFDSRYLTKCEIWGDFDARVSFELVSWPAKDGITAFLAAYFDGATQATQVGRRGGGGAAPFEEYVTSLRGFGNAVQTADTTGGLRIARRDGNVTTYYRYRGQWMPLGSRYVRGTARLTIGVGASAAEFGKQPAVVAFDNFRATAPEGAINCAGVPYPPRKQRSRT